jgi:2-alkenal reductase
MRSQNRLVLLILICLAVAAAFIYFNRFADRGRRIVSQPREILPRGDLADFEKSTITIFNNAAPSVVYIFTENAESGFFGRRGIQQGAVPDFCGITTAMW